MKNYDTPEKLARAIRGLWREKRRLRDETIALKAQYEEVLRRFRGGKLAGDRARDLAYAIRDRLELIQELLPLVERRANDLALKYVECVYAGGGRLPVLGTKMPARARRPAAGDELRN